MLSSKSVNLNTTSRSKFERNSSQVDVNKLRRESIGKKSEIEFLERESSKLDELRDLLTVLMEDYQYNGRYKFYQNIGSLKKILKNPVDGVALLRDGINMLIDKHQKISSRFDLEMNKSLFSIEKDYLRIEEMRKKEFDLLKAAEVELDHKRSILKTILNEKKMVQKTVLLRMAALDRNIQYGTKKLQKIDMQKVKVEKDLEEAKYQLKDHQTTEYILQERDRDRKDTGLQQKKTHEDIIKQLDKVRRDYKREAFEHNRTQANLKAARDELASLIRKANSYHDNMKTQELLAEEEENRKQHSNYNVEMDEAKRKQEKEEKKTRELEAKVNDLTTSILDLNYQISTTEQRLQSQMTRIPDFAQLHAALERSIDMSRKFKEQVNANKYIMDEIRERIQSAEEMEINESRIRTASYLKPLPEDKFKREKTEKVSTPTYNDYDINDILTPF